MFCIFILFIINGIHVCVIICSFYLWLIVNCCNLYVVFLVFFTNLNYVLNLLIAEQEVWVKTNFRFNLVFTDDKVFLNLNSYSWSVDVTKTCKSDWQHDWQWTKDTPVRLTHTHTHMIDSSYYCHPPSVAAKKLKKGQATAKQRLSKILKMNKMRF